ncbi:anti-sigma factor antagonist [Streptomyces xanthochromogenes]|uniref:STAS domain-containing protein n=1 Tax=Streptomyces TaxID=1883 RepID=UPI001420774F|nr:MULTISPECIES: STAS domain-containing protein [Streptomyces]GHB38808.1 anti-sigma factor antagonist [Streptomyces xanthochromogenes]
MTDPTLTATRHTHSRGATVLAVAGELDHHTAPELSRLIQDTSFGPEVPVLIDLSELTYCDSTGITVLIGADRRARQEGGSLSLVAVNPDLMHVFRIIGLDQLFTFQPTVEDAIDALHA